MADVTVTAARLRIQENQEARLIPMIAGEAITRGQVLYRNTDGTARLARANAVGTSKVVGVATKNAAAGAPVSALYHGRLAGFDLGSINPGTTLYLSAATAGAVADTAPSGTGNVVAAIGTVHVMTDVAQTPFLFVDVPLNAEPVALA